MSLRVDLHIHTHHSPDASTSPDRLVARCLQVGLNCIAVTDHNTLRGARETARIAPFRVILGEEVKTAEGDLVGLFLKEEIPPGLPPAETARRIKAQGGLVMLPHPYDRLRRSVLTPRALREVLPYADIVEVFNARNVFQADNRRAEALARQAGLLRSAVSDAHHPLELGRTYMEMPDFDGTPQGFLSALARARLVCRPSSPLVHLISTGNKALNRLRRLGRPSGG